MSKNLHKIYITLEKMNSLMVEQKHEEAIKLEQATLKNNNEISPENREVWYNKGVSLDMTGNPQGGFEIFDRLVSLYPGNLRYRKSYKITLGRISDSVNELLEKKPSDEFVVKQYEFFLKHDWVTLPLLRHWGCVRIRAGDVTPVREVFSAILRLNPNDADYIDAALKLARLSEDKAWETEIEDIRQVALEKFPFRFDLTTRHLRLVTF